jgi:PAS domain S-box-containing protein
MLTFEFGGGAILFCRGNITKLGNARHDRCGTGQTGQHRRSIADTQRQSSPWPLGGGDMGERIRTRNWAGTPLGPVEAWPSSLKVAVDICLASAFPTCVAWGPNLIQIYNDAGIALMDARHPTAFGASARDLGVEVWPIIGPLARQVLSTGEPERIKEASITFGRSDAADDAVFTVSYGALRNECGDIAGLLVTALEITEHVRLRKQLRESERRQAFLLKLSDALQPLTDPGEIQSIACRLLGEHLGVNRVIYADVYGEEFVVRRGYSKGVASLSGRNSILAFDQFLVYAHHRGIVAVDDICRDARFTTAERAVFKAREIAALAGVMHIKEGRWVGFFAAHSATARAWTEAEIEFVRQVAERIWGAAERARAEVALRESKERLRLTFDALASAILTIDTHGVIQSTNLHTTLLFGYASEDLIGQNVRMLMTKPLRPEHDDDIVSYLETGQKKIIGNGQEVTARRADGSTFPIHFAVSGFEDAGKRYFTAIITDLTERRGAEEAMRMYERRLSHSQKIEAVGQLTGGVAHDINNILTVISGNLELAMSRRDYEARYFIRQALDAIETGASLNRRLLSFARRRELEPVVLFLNDRVSEVARLLRQSAGEQIALFIKLAPDLWQTRADAGEVDNALLNLALNARDAMSGDGALTIETGNVTLDATAAARDPDARPGDYVRFSVTDTGHGMTPEVQRRAVEPFFTTKETGKGTGLGLSSVYGFAAQPGGFLTIESEVGRGTTVTVFLPRLQ